MTDQTQPPLYTQERTAQGTNGLAVASFVLSLVTLCGIGSLLGVIFGHISLGQIKRKPQGGRGLAIAGLVLGYLGLAAAVLIVVLLIAASSDTSSTGSTKNGVKSLSGNQAHPPQDDVTVSACKADSLGDLQATVVVTNHSTGRSNYIISIAFENSNGSTQLDTTTVLANNLEPGQRTTQQGGSFTKAPSGGFKCRVTEVNRFAS